MWMKFKAQGLFLVFLFSIVKYGMAATIPFESKIAQESSPSIDNNLAGNPPKSH